MEVKEQFKEYDIFNYIKIANILDKYLFGHEGFVCGGVFKNLFNGEKFKDIDVFFETKEKYLKALDLYKENKDYYKFYNNAKVDAFKHKHTGVVVELIKYKFGDPYEIIADFDFTITKCAYVNNYKNKQQMEELIETLEPDDEIEDFLKKSILIVHNDFFEHLHTKRLVVDDKMVLPINTFERMFRYAKYGYFPCRETKVKIIGAIRELPDFSEELISMGLYNGLD